MTVDGAGTDTALVTGAAGVIGRTIVPTLVAEGYTVAAVDRKDPAEPFAELVEAGRVVPIVADLGTSDGRAAVVDAARRGLGRIRCLVNNAADASELSLRHATDEHWRAVLETNVIAPAALVRDLADDLADGGVVVNISSVRGLGCLPGAAAYEASKSAVLSLTRTIASELGSQGTRAVTVCPGAIVEDPETWLDVMPAAYGDAWTATQPMGRAGGTDAIADVIAFLCSDRAYHVNGVELVVDGGAIAQYPATAALRLAGHIRA